jgi:Protein of unknown function (DUF1684)
VTRLVVTLLALAAPLSAQAIPIDLAQERARLASWLLNDPTSPTHALARREVGGGLVLGPASGDIPLGEVPEHRVSEANGRVVLSGPEGERVLPRGRPTRLSNYTVQVDGAPGRGVLTVFGASGRRKIKADFFPYDPALTFEGTLAPPEQATRQRVLGPDGIETDAVEAGTVRVPFGEKKVRLRVLRLRTPDTDESELTIFFRDGSNGAGTYPAGRFVDLVPTAPGRYRLDFNRAHNPYCAYSTVYPCPAPWRGNTIPVPVHAGERYLGGGLTAPPPDSEVP